MSRFNKVSAGVDNRRSSLMRSVRRAILIAVIAGLGLAPTLRVAHAQSLAGQWRYLEVITCTRSAANSDICSSLLGPGNITRFVNGFYAKCDAGGHCTYNAFFNASAYAPGMHPLCSPDIFTTPFSGTCRETERGTVQIQGPPSATGLPDFFITDEYANYYGSPPLLNVHDPAGAGAYPLDVGVPAVPGFYDTRRYLTLLGLQSPGQTPPSGVINFLLVTHT